MQKSHQKKIKWFYIYSSQTQYLMQKKSFEEYYFQFKNIKDFFDFIPIKNNYSKDSKNFQVKSESIVKMKEYLYNNEFFFFTDLDTFFDFNNINIEFFYNLLLNHSAKNQRIIHYEFSPFSETIQKGNGYGLGAQYFFLKKEDINIFEKYFYKKKEKFEMDDERWLYFLYKEKPKCFFAFKGNHFSNKYVLSKITHPRYKKFYSLSKIILYYTDINQTIPLKEAIESNGEEYG